MPIIAGDEVTLNGNKILENNWETSNAFNGSGSSSQSNKLDGQITVSAVINNSTCTLTLQV